MTEQLEPVPRPPIWRTALLVLLCMFASLTSFVFSEVGQDPVPLVGMLGILAALVLPVSLCWRHRAPLAITLVVSGVALLLPLGTSTALVALVSLLTWRSSRWEWPATAAVAVATAVTFVRDVLAPSASAAFLQTVLAPPDTPPEALVPLSWWVVPIAVVLTVGPAVGIGLLRRANRTTRLADARAASAGRQRAQLGDELARQRERERIAREVHDVLGHRLSLLNLHAGALEVNARDDAQLAQSAALVRASAARSMDDLRSLLAVLREDPDAEPTMREPSLADLPAMIEEAVAAGAPVSSSVFLDRAETADPALARAVYRVVQELLTNARKHASGAQVRLSVQGGPAEGICIDARNSYLGAGAGHGPGQGLQGVAERVELLGGHLAYGLDDGGATFRVTVTLPWRC
ncbi:sensor histidine kinase [Ruania albidiflava]|uniref:sensor histidine kinase n=1 Tax=Ruania albidiflava TaxID=366586 RepID=UPI0003B59FF5|nr:histidine kinase [Ruania albidiflava]